MLRLLWHGDLKVHCDDAVVKLGQSLIRELDPKLTGLDEKIAAVSPQTAPVMRLAEATQPSSLRLRCLPLSQRIGWSVLKEQ